MRKMNIIKSKTSPSKQDLWLTVDKNGKPVIKKWSQHGWEQVFGSMSDQSEELKKIVYNILNMAPEDLDTFKEVSDKIEDLNNTLDQQVLINNEQQITIDEHLDSLNNIKYDDETGTISL